MTPLLDVRGLSVHFPVYKGFLRRQVGTVRAVDDVDLQVHRGKTLALVGESGCGKTTTGRAILRLVEPVAGSIRFSPEGEALELRSLDAEGLRKARRHLQMVFQDPYASLNPRHTVAQIVGRPMRLHGLATASELDEKVRAVLGEVGLPADAMDRYPHEFSGGQRQRIGIARAIALEPELLVFDEAVSALDVSVRAQVLNLILSLQERHGFGAIFITHDLGVVRHLADEVAVMYLGQIVERAPTAQLFDTPRHPYTQALLSAVPEVDKAKRRSRVALQGEVPSPLNPPSGCRFHPRCPQVMDRCRTEAPPVTADEHTSVRCHLFPG